MQCLPNVVLIISSVCVCVCVRLWLWLSHDMFLQIDSDDLPLNVSREMLQQNKLLMVIKRKLIRKALDMFKKMDEETYVTFWKEFGTSIKLGVLEDKKNRSRLSKLLRFASSNDPEKLTSLDDYVSRMKEKQEAIYFMAGSTREEVENSPFVERLLRRGYEVLYFVEPVDEYSVQNLEDYEKKKFQNVAKVGGKRKEGEYESTVHTGTHCILCVPECAH